MLKKNGVNNVGNLSNESVAQFCEQSDQHWVTHSTAPQFRQSINGRCGHRVVTDGFSASLQLINPNRPAQDSHKKPLMSKSAVAPSLDSVWLRGSQTFEAICEAINTASLDSHVPLVALDPGRRFLFTTAI